METLLLVGLTGLAGYYLKTDRKKEEGSIDSIMAENQKPNSLNIYNSDKVNASNDELLKLSLNNYKDAQNPSLTGVLPPIYNSYSSVGNDFKIPISEPHLSEVNDINRRKNVMETTPPILSERPMFKLSQMGSLTDDAFSNFGGGNSEVSLLTGQPIQRDHSNMVPFFGSNLKQNVENFTNEAKLDNFTGNKSTFIHKTEQAPRFEKFSQDIYGTPLLTDHVDTSRYIPSAYRQNEKPFDDIKVAAPISGTLNNPLNNVKEPTIDSLRIATNKQVSYAGRMKAGQLGSVRGVSVEVMKNRPDTHFELGHDRLFTSTGAVIGKKSTDNYQNMQETSRQNQNLEYYGNSYKDKESSQRLKYDNTNEFDFSSLVQEPKRNQLESDTMRNMGSNGFSVNDYGKNSYNFTEMERETTNSGNQALNINMSNSGHQIGLQDELYSTMKETLIEKQDNTGNISTLKKYDSNITDYTFKTTQKETLINNKYKGQASKKDGMGYTVVNPEAKTTNKEINCNNSYSGHANDTNKNSMVYSTFENPEKVRNAVHIENYKGVGGYHTSASENRQQFENAEITAKKENLLKGQRPGGRKSTLGSISNNTLGKTKLTPNMLFKERANTRKENIHTQSIIPSKNSLGIQDQVFNNFSEVENNRLNVADISKQLSTNPYYNLR